MDIENDSLLKQFCDEAEEEKVIKYSKEVVLPTHEKGRSDVFENRLDKADELREAGNLLFKKSEYADARFQYYAAIYQLDFDIGQQWNMMEKHTHDLNARKLKVISNICGAFLKECDYQNTKRAADIGLRHMQKGEMKDSDAEAKFYYRKGVANLKRGFAEDAVHALRKAEAASPGDAEVRKLLREAKVSEVEDKAKAKQVWKNKLLSEDEKQASGNLWRPSALFARCRMRCRRMCKRKG